MFLIAHLIINALPITKQLLSHFRTVASYDNVLPTLFCSEPIKIVQGEIKLVTHCLYLSPLSSYNLLQPQAAIL